MSGPDRSSPLSPEEQALARVLRALPAGDPPSHLDARILSMARDAVVGAPSQPDEAAPRPRGRSLGRLGLGAGLLLAAVLAWRAGSLDPPAPEQAPAAPAAIAPEAWIEAIRRSRDAGHLEDARRELAAFVDAHPDHPLPEDLSAIRENP